MSLLLKEDSVQELMSPTARDTEKDANLSQDSFHEPVQSLSIELSRISAEIQSISSGFQMGMQQAIVDTCAAFEKQYQDRFEKSMETVREQLQIEIRQALVVEFEEKLIERISYLGNVQKEIERVATSLEVATKEITAMLDDPSIDLSRVMQKRKEQAELKAYLEGLRFSIGETKPKTIGT